MIGKAWLLKGYYESGDAHPSFAHTDTVDVVSDEGEFWGCECWVVDDDGLRSGWIMGVRKRYIEFIPPYLVKKD